MTGCDLRNRHEKSSGSTAFSCFFAIKIKFLGNDVMLFNDIYISKNHIRQPRSTCDGESYMYCYMYLLSYPKILLSRVSILQLYRMDITK